MWYQGREPKEWVEAMMTQHLTQNRKIFGIEMWGGKIEWLQRFLRVEKPTIHC